jgi:hypothetical protein
MTFEEVLKLCEWFPDKLFKVKCESYVKHATDVIGQVKRIEITPGSRSVGVDFPGCHWLTWFSDSESTDQRRHYLRDITPFISEDKQP